MLETVSDVGVLEDEEDVGAFVAEEGVGTSVYEEDVGDLDGGDVSFAALGLGGSDKVPHVSSEAGSEFSCKIQRATRDIRI